MYVPEAGDLVWLDFNPQAGHEQAGRRPALVLSDSRFNAKIGLAFVCPVSSKVKGYTTEVLLPEGLPIHGAVLCAHLRSVDWRARNSTPIGKLHGDALQAVRDIVAAIAGITG